MALSAECCPLAEHEKMAGGTSRANGWVENLLALHLRVGIARVRDSAVELAKHSDGHIGHVGVVHAVLYR